MLNEILKLFCRCFNRTLSLLIKEISVSLLFSETRGSKNGYLSDNGFWSLSLFQNIAGSEVAEPVRGAKIHNSIFALADASSGETCHWNIVPEIVIVDIFFISNKTADSLIGAEPDILVFIFLNGPDKGIGQSLIALVDFIFPR